MVRNNARVHCSSQRNDVPSPAGVPYKYEHGDCAEGCESTHRKHLIGCITFKQLHQMRVAVSDSVSAPLPRGYGLIQGLLNCDCGVPHLSSQPSWNVGKQTETQRWSRLDCSGAAIVA